MIPDDPNALLTRDATAVALTESGYPTSQGEQRWGPTLSPLWSPRSLSLGRRARLGGKAPESYRRQHF
jgi:hypothetical protein